MNNTMPNTLYLSRLFLNPYSRQVFSELPHPYEMHRTLMRAFPDVKGKNTSNAREKHKVLFRVEPHVENGHVKVYVQSCYEPDWTTLETFKDYLCPDIGIAAYECKNVMPIYQNIKNGQIVSFRLRANPTKRIAKLSDEMRGKRVELQKEEEQISWLIRKGQGLGKENHGGFELLMRETVNSDGAKVLIPKMNVSHEGKCINRKKAGHTGGYVTTHMAVLYEGLIRVIDKNNFLKTLINGIGPGKAFGFGLLTIAPSHFMESDDFK
ncbi:type I-E CRISPR-associated protein Cas6/Cse3/CasE [Aminobacterium mobile]|uniref:type I-E CRISPR-associated protein Cas6/Cse3/CasE n=1 Tax=Aminobacterium mobile TaxID=81467 RepID=UPI0033153A74